MHFSNVVNLLGPVDTSRQPCSTLRRGIPCAAVWVALATRIAIPNVSDLSTLFSNFRLSAENDAAMKGRAAR